MVVGGAVVAGGLVAGGAVVVGAVDGDVVDGVVERGLGAVVVVVVVVTTRSSIATRAPPGPNGFVRGSGSSGVPTSVEAGAGRAGAVVSTELVDGGIVGEGAADAGGVSDAVASVAAAVSMPCSTPMAPAMPTVATTLDAPTARRARRAGCGRGVNPSGRIAGPIGASVGAT